MPDLKLIGVPRRGKILKADDGGDLRECRSLVEDNSGKVKIADTTFVVDPKKKSVQIGKGDADPTAALAINSTTRGLLLPRLTTDQEEAIVSPTDGLLIYNTNDGRVRIREDGSWKNILTGLLGDE